MANPSDKFCLKWNDFQQNMVDSFRDLRTDTAFSDVTLVSDENQYIEAHQIILKACSPFFSKVLTRNKNSHPIIYMRGLKAKDIKAIVDFIYHGEADIYQEDLDGFLALAEEFQLKGLARSESVIKEPTEQLKEPYQKSIIIKPEKFSPNISELGEISPDTSLKECRTTSFDETDLVKIDTTIVLSEALTKEDLEAKITSLVERVDDGINSWKCTVCGKTAKAGQTIKRHIETHLEGLSYTCNQCGKVSKSSNALNAHVSVYHRN